MRSRPAVPAPSQVGGAWPDPTTPTPAGLRPWRTPPAPAIPRKGYTDRTRQSVGGAGRGSPAVASTKLVACVDREPAAPRRQLERGGGVPGAAGTRVRLHEAVGPGQYGDRARRSDPGGRGEREETGMAHGEAEHGCAQGEPCRPGHHEQQAAAKHRRPSGGVPGPLAGAPGPRGRAPRGRRRGAPAARRRAGTDRRGRAGGGPGLPQRPARLGRRAPARPGPPPAAASPAVRRPPRRWC